MAAVAVTSLDIENHSQTVSGQAACGGCRTASPNPSVWSSRSAVSGRDEGHMTSPEHGPRARGGTAREAGRLGRTSGRVTADEVDVLTDEAFLGRAQGLTDVGQLPARAGRSVRQFIRTRVEGCRLGP